MALQADAVPRISVSNDSAQYILDSVYIPQKDICVRTTKIKIMAKFCCMVAKINSTKNKGKVEENIIINFFLPILSAIIPAVAKTKILPKEATKIIKETVSFAMYCLKKVSMV